MKLLSRSSSTRVTLFVATWMVASCNAAFWSEMWHLRGGTGLRGLAFLASLFVVGVLYVNLLLSLAVFRHVGRPLLAIALLVSSVVAYFTSTLGVRIDETMIRNVFETDTSEVSELLTGGLFLHVALLGVLPAVLFLRSPIEYESLGGEIVRKLSVAGLTVLAALPIAAFFYADYASLMRNHRELRHVITPPNYLASTFGYLKHRFAAPREIRPIGLDAHRRTTPSGAGRLQLLVLVVGETARGADFSLGGYPRPTNPELASEPVLYFSQVRSSGTSTATSLPCMFSDSGRERFDADRDRHREDLLDVLVHAGFEVLWRDNDSGCKGVCDRVEYESLARSTDPELCSTGECYDEILLSGFQERLDRAARDLVVVLHMHGSHGPGYHLRYPPAFKRFAPVCETLELEDCSREELLNAYDNTIVYTDHVLTSLIHLLEANAARFDAGMIYVSDHGESLGEKGLYLHGMPYWMAPDEQTHVPMIVWVSEGLRRRRNLDGEALAARCGDAISHDHLFHSVLGLLAVETSLYRADLDLFRGPVPD